MTFSWSKFIEEVAAFQFEYEWMRELIIAQAILESGRGTTPIAMNNCNFNGMKYRESVSEFGGKKFQYFTNSEPFRDSTGKVVAPGTPGAKRWDWFFEFPDYKAAIKTWCAFWFRSEGSWVPYPKVRAKDPKVMSSLQSFLEYVGPIYCPYFTASHNESYASYIINKCLPEAAKLIEKAKSEAPKFKSYRGELDPLTMRLRIIEEPGARVYAIAETDMGVNWKLKAAISAVEDIGGYRTIIKAWDTSKANPEPKPKNGYKILLDPGHSEAQTGARGTSPEVQEEDLNRFACSMLQMKLRNEGFVCDIYDPSNDNLTEIGSRAGNYDMFISFHHNAYDRKEHYACVMVHRDVAKTVSKQFASMVAKRIGAAIGLSIIQQAGELPGVYPAGLGVLRAAENSECPGPCVLIEPYFIDAYGDWELCKKRTAKAVDATFECCVEWAGGKS